MRTACRLEAGHIEVPDDYGRSDEVLAGKQQVMDGERLNVAEAERLLEELSLLNAYLGKEQEKLEKDYGDAAASRDLTREACTKAEGILRSFRQMEDAEKVLAGCRAREEEIGESRKRILSIQNALEIRQVFNSFREAVQTVEDTKEEVGRLEAALPDQRAVCERKLKLEEEADHLRRQEADRFTKTKERVTKACDVLRQLADAEKSLAEREKKAAASAKAADDAAAGVQKLEAQKKAWTEEKSRLADADVRWNLFRENTLAGYNRLLDERSRVSKADMALAEQKRALEKAADEYRDAWQIYQKKNKHILKRCSQT